MSEERVIKVIVSFDGGGCLGCISARLFERAVYDNPSILRGGVMYAGSSAGAIIASGCAVGFSPSEIVEMFSAATIDIFSNKKSAGILVPKYGWKDAVRYMTEAFGDKIVKHAKLSNNELIVTAFDLTNGANVYFSSLSIKDSDYPIHEACLRSMAAPTYFESRGNMIDGGVTVNNPSLVAVTEFVRNNSGAQIPPVISFGTGSCRFKRTSSGQGALGWGRDIVPLFLGLQDDVTHEIASKLLPKYLRINPDITCLGKVEMDDTSFVKDGTYIDVADEYYDMNRGKIKEFIDAYC
jgi:patatin-like phospholipase/acyl hydrolase